MTKHRITVDGKDISDAIQSATVYLGGDRDPEVMLNLLLDKEPTAGTEVWVPWATHKALELLGWTPPPDPDDPPAGEVRYADWAIGLALNLLRGHHKVECTCNDDNHRCAGWKCGKCGEPWQCSDDLAQSTLLEARQRLNYPALSERVGYSKWRGIS